MAANWSDLLPEMLENIARNCFSSNLKDFVNFSRVCTSWQRAATVVKADTALVRYQMPWLMLCENRKNCKRNLFDLNNRKRYTLNLPEAFGKRSFGTGTGWLLTVSLDREIQLFNPLTKARLNLPSQRTFLHQPFEYDSDSEEDDSNRDERNVKVLRWFIRKAFVVRSPDCKDELLVVVIYGFTLGYIAVAMPGSTKWTPIHDEANKSVHDAAYCHDLGLMLFLNTSGAITSWDLNLDSIQDGLQPLLAVKDYLPCPNFFPIGNTMRYDQQFYLLESFGNILIVERWYARKVTRYTENMYFQKYQYNTKHFAVYKLDLHTKEWNELKDLGDLALFVGTTPATSVKASRFTRCKGNSIYFDDDGSFKYFWYCTVDGLGGHDMGVFDVGNGNIEVINPGGSCRSSYSGPVWFVPEIN